MAKDAAVASTMIFIMTIPLVSGQHRLPEAPRTERPKRDAPLFPSPLSQSGFHRCTINDALTALTTQPKSACITCAIDPFQESVARIARTLPREAIRIAVLQTTGARVRSAGRFRWCFMREPKPISIRILFKTSRIGARRRRTDAIGIREGKAARCSDPVAISPILVAVAGAGNAHAQASAARFERMSSLMTRNRLRVLRSPTRQIGHLWRVSRRGRPR